LKNCTALTRSMQSTGRGERRAAIYLRRPRNAAWSRRAFLKKSFPDFYSRGYICFNKSVDKTVCAY
jgi:hypothetical protein